MGYSGSEEGHHLGDWVKKGNNVSHTNKNHKYLITITAMVVTKL